MLWKQCLIAFSIQSTSPSVIEERSAFTVLTFLMIVSKVGSRVPKKQLSSPCNKSSPLESGLSTAQYLFKKVISLSLKQRTSILVHSF